MKREFSAPELASLFGGTGFQPVGRSGILPDEIRIIGFATDSRSAKPGDLFIAIRGANVDGRDYLDKTQASLALVENAPPHPLVANPPIPLIIVDDIVEALARFGRLLRAEFKGPVIGVTGSVGKSTVKEFIAAALAPLGEIIKTEGNRNTEYTAPLLWAEVGPDTKAVVVEMGMRGLGQIAHLASIAQPTIGVITNIGVTHLSELGSLENIAKAKAELIEGLFPPSPRGEGSELRRIGVGSTLPAHESPQPREGEARRANGLGSEETALTETTQPHVGRDGSSPDDVPAIGTPPPSGPIAIVWADDPWLNLLKETAQTAGAQIQTFGEAKTRSMGFQPMSQPSSEHGPSAQVTNYQTNDWTSSTATITLNRQSQVDRPNSRQSSAESVVSQTSSVEPVAPNSRQSSVESVVSQTSSVEPVARDSRQSSVELVVNQASSSQTAAGSAVPPTPIGVTESSPGLSEVDASRQATPRGAPSPHERSWNPAEDRESDRSPDSSFASSARPSRQSSVDIVANQASSSETAVGNAAPSTPIGVTESSPGLSEVDASRQATPGGGPSPQERSRNPAEDRESDRSPDSSFASSARPSRQSSVELVVSLPVVGRHFALAAAAALLVADAAGVDPTEAADALSKVQLPPMRMAVREHEGIAWVLDMYNAAPASTIAALETVAEVAKGPKYAILGEMRELGDATEQGHREVGAALARLGFKAAITLDAGAPDELQHSQTSREGGDGPCLAQPTANILQAAIEAGMSESNLTHAASFEEVRAWLRDRKAGDTILVKGSRGVELEKVVPNGLTTSH